MTMRRTDGGARKRKQEKENSDEVEEMLRAAQDELLLKLSVDSHMSRVAPDYLLPDLDRRFQALKSQPSPSQSVKSQPPPPPARRPDDTNALPQGDPDDLVARFAALKGSSSTSAPAANGFDYQGLDNGDEDDEFEKIIRWAKDAARLDPYPPSDDEEEEEEADDDSEEDGQVEKQSKK